MSASFTKISELPAATTLADADLLAAYVSGSTFAANKITFANLVAAIGERISSPAQLPSWRFGNSSSGAGQFTADSEVPQNTTHILLNNTPLNGPSFATAFANILIGTLLVMTGDGGKPSVFLVDSVTIGSPTIDFRVTALGAVGSSWIGDYSLTFWPGSPA